MIDDFKARLETAYSEWDSSGARTPALFFDLMDEAIEFHSVLESEFADDPLGGPFIGKAAVLGYYAGIAESWDLVTSRTDRLVAEGDTAVWTGHVQWRHRRTLRLLDSPKIDVWTVWNGKAIRYREMFDSFNYARAIGLIDPPPDES